MANSRKRRLDSAVAAIHRRHGIETLRKGGTLRQDSEPLPPAISTSFPSLDQITGCRGIPLNQMILLSGQSTSGKLTLAYKILANAQRSSKRRSKNDAESPAAAIVDLTQTSDPDYLHRCGVDLDQLMIAYPRPDEETVHLLFDLIQQKEPGIDGLRLILVDGVSDLNRAYQAMRALETKAGLLSRALRNSGCTLLFIDEPAPPWQRWFNLDSSRAIRTHASLHIELHHEEWLYRPNPIMGGQLQGYRAIAQIRKSKWAQKGKKTSIAIEFNGTVRARKTF